MLQDIKNILLEHRVIQVLFVLAGIFPLIVLGVYTYLVIYQNGTQATLNRRESTGRSIAQLAKQRFDFLVFQGNHYASRPQFQALIRERKWEEALAGMIAEQSPSAFGVDRVLLIAPDSTPQADYPPISDFQNIKGKQYKDREWYVGVSRTWEPYITQVFKRLTEPKINLISVVIPIKSIKPEEKGKILGILNLSTTLDKFYVWSKTLSPDEKSTLYFVDQIGQVAGHPSISEDSAIVNYAHVPAVARLLAGNEGVAVLTNPIEKKEEVAAYFAIGAYHWGVVLSQDADIAFRERDAQLSQIFSFFIILIVITFIIFYLLYKQFGLIHKYRFHERVLLESIGDGVFVVDKQFTIVLWNKAASSITGLFPQDVVGKACCDVFTFIDGKTHRNKSHLIQESIRKGEAKSLDSTTVMVLKDGKKIPIGDSVAPIVSASGKVDGAIVVFHDMTQEQAFHQAKDEFLSIAAHQLRTPLGVMRWNMELMLKNAYGTITKEMKGALSDMFINNLNLIKLVNDLLDVSRINQEKIVNTPKSVDALSVIRAVAKECAREIKSKAITLKVAAPGTHIPGISVDPELFKQLMRNLVTNAVKYNRDHGTIEIRVAKEDAAVHIAVKDSGIGIPKHQLNTVFDTFSRADNAVRLGIAGTGLGLFVVKSYLHLWGGKIWLESEEGKGTTVHVTIPYAK